MTYDDTLITEWFPFYFIEDLPPWNSNYEGHIEFPPPLPPHPKDQRCFIQIPTILKREC